MEILLSKNRSCQETSMKQLIKHISEGYMSGYMYIYIYIYTHYYMYVYIHIYSYGLEWRGCHLSHKHQTTLGIKSVCFVYHIMFSMSQAPNCLKHIAYIVPVRQAMLMFSITNNTKRRGTRLRQKNTIEQQHS